MSEVPVVEPDQGTGTPRRRRTWVEGLLLIAGSTAFLFVLTSIALLIYTDGTRDAIEHVFVVDPGSSELIEQGENPLDLPAIWPFLADDTLVIDNRDSVVHTIGDWATDPNAVGRFDLQPSSGGFVASTLHPSGGVTLDIEARDYDFSIIAVAVFGFGFSVGIILWIGLTVVRALGREPDVSEYLTSTRPVATTDE